MVSGIGAFLLTWLIHEGVLRPLLTPYRIMGQYNGFWRAHPSHFLASYLAMFIGWSVLLRFLATLVWIGGDLVGDPSLFLINGAINVSMASFFLVPGSLLLMRGASAIPSVVLPPAKS